jgi:hypothetical protein
VDAALSEYASKAGLPGGVTATWKMVEQRAPRMSGQGSAGLRKGDWEIETSVDGAGGAKGYGRPWLPFTSL